MDCMDVDDDDDDDKLFPYMAMDMNPEPMASLGSVDNDESLAFGDEVDEELFSLFFMVEFQKFFISLSVRPGKRAAIWDHLLPRMECKWMMSSSSGGEKAPRLRSGLR